MSSSTTIHANHDSVIINTRINKVWEFQKHSDKDTAYAFTISTNERDEVCLFLTLEQLEELGVAIDVFIASAVDPLPEPTVNDLAKSQAESEQGWSLA
jgi:hypothetical protein